MRVSNIINSVQNITYILQKLQTHIYIVNVQGSSSIEKVKTPSNKLSLNSFEC